MKEIITNKYNLKEKDMTEIVKIINPRPEINLI